MISLVTDFLQQKDDFKSFGTIVNLLYNTVYKLRMLEQKEIIRCKDVLNQLHEFFHVHTRTDWSKFEEAIRKQVKLSYYVMTTVLERMIELNPQEAEAAMKNFPIGSLVHHSIKSKLKL